MIKIAQIEAVWPKIYQKLKSPPPGINLGAFPSKLPPMNKIRVEGLSPAGEPQAVGYVSTEDVDGDGNLDVIHIASPRLAQELQRIGVDADALQRIDTLSPQELAPILSAFVEIISHELGHVEDFRPGEESPFPGGEPVAEQAARSAVQQISVATNISNSFNKTRSFTMDILDTLNKLASDLDSREEFALADKVVRIMEKVAQETDAELAAQAISKIQRSLGARETGAWDAATQAAWKDFVYNDYAGEDAPLLEASWMDFASKHGYRTDATGLIPFIQEYKRAPVAKPAPAEQDLDLVHQKETARGLRELYLKKLQQLEHNLPNFGISEMWKGSRAVYPLTDEHSSVESKRAAAEKLIASSAGVAGLDIGPAEAEKLRHAVEQLARVQQDYEAAQMAMRAENRAEDSSAEEQVKEAKEIVEFESLFNLPNRAGPFGRD